GITSGSHSVLAGWLTSRWWSPAGCFFFFSSRRRHTRWPRDWSSDVCSSDLSLHSSGCAASPGSSASESSAARASMHSDPDWLKGHRDLHEVLRPEIELAKLCVARTFVSAFLSLSGANLGNGQSCCSSRRRQPPVVHE